MSTIGLRALDVVAEQHAWLNAADALVLVQTAKSCLSVAKRAVIRRPGGVLVAPNLVGVPEARRRKLGGTTGLCAIARLLDGVMVQACALAHISNLHALAASELARVLGHCSTVVLQDCFSPPLVRSTTLRELRIGYGRLGTDQLSALVAACPPQLEGLILAGCSVSTKDPFLAALGRAPCAPNLRRLDLAGMKKLTGDGFNEHLRNRLPRLETLGLDGCDNVDIGDVLIIGQTEAPYPALRSLHAERLAPSKRRPYPGPSEEYVGAVYAVACCIWMALTDVCLAGQCNGAWTLDRHKNPVWEGALGRHGDDAAASGLGGIEAAMDGIEAAGGPVPSANGRDRATRAVTALRRLDTRGRVALPVAIYYVWRTAPFLIDLDVSNSDDDVPGRLVKLCARLPALCSLSVASLEPSLDDARLAAALAALPNPTRLRLLDVSGNASITSDGVADAKRRIRIPQIVSKIKARLVVVARGIDGVSQRRPRARCGGGDCCSFERHGVQMVKQDAFGCATCGLDGRGDALCTTCATTCHKGHNVFYIGHIKMYCDCPRTCGNCG
jgi:hypothetical protein